MTLQQTSESCVQERRFRLSEPTAIHTSSMMQSWTATRSPPAARTIDSASCWPIRFSGPQTVPSEPPEPPAVADSAPEGRRIRPALAEDLRQVADGGPPDLQLHVVPGRAGPVSIVHPDRLRITLVLFVVAPPVEQVNPAHEGDVVAWPVGPVKQHDLLVVRAEPADPLIEENLAASQVQHLPDMERLALAVPRLVRMRTPHQRTHIRPAVQSLGHNRSEFGSVPGQALADIAPPVQEPHLVSGPHQGKLPVQPGEVRAAVNQRNDHVSLSPPAAVAATPVNLRRFVASLLRAQQPALLGREIRILGQQGSGNERRLADAAAAAFEDHLISTSSSVSPSSISISSSNVTSSGTSNSIFSPPRLSSTSPPAD